MTTLLALGCALAVAGCTSSGSNDSATKMRSVLLQLSDFPPTWRAYPQSDKAPDLLGQIAVCAGVVNDAGGITTVRSSEFRHLEQRITSTAVSLNTEQDVSTRVTALGSPKADRCAAQAARQRVLDALPGATVRSATFSVSEGGVNVAINYAGVAHGVVNVDVEGRPAKVYVDAVFVLGSRFYSDITFLGVNTPVPDSIQHVLTDDVALRAQHA